MPADEEQGVLRVLVRRVVYPHSDDAGLGVPTWVHGGRSLGPATRVVSRARVLPLRVGRVRPGESPGPDPTRPIHVPFPQLQGLHLPRRHGDKPNLLLDPTGSREPAELRPELPRRHSRFLR